MTIFCAISGTVAKNPVFCKADGFIYEKDLLVKYLHEHENSSPMNPNGPLIDIETDVVDVKNQEKISPGTKSPFQGSIPATLLQLQNEWDALMLETFNLKTQFHTTQQQLSNALYENDAAKRVIARLIKERDEARVALSELKLQYANTTPAPTGTAKKNVESEDMQVDQEVTPLPSNVLDLLDSVNEDLSTARRKRKAPETLATASQISSFTVKEEWKTLNSAKDPAISCIEISGSNVLIGGVDGTVSLLQPPADSSSSESQLLLATSSKCHKKSITSVAWVSSDAFLTGSLDGSVKVWSLESSTAKKDTGGVKFKGTGGGKVIFDHGISGIAMHPSKSLFCSTGVESNSWNFTDINTLEFLDQVVLSEPGHITSSVFHPDGLLYAVGTSNGTALLYDIKSRQVASPFTHHDQGEGVLSMAFSENGYHFCTASSNVVHFWDLRKLEKIYSITDVDKVVKIRFDDSGKYVGIAHESMIGVYAVKKWDLIKEFDHHVGQVSDFVWGKDASFLLSGALERRVCLLA